MTATRLVLRLLLPLLCSAALASCSSMNSALGGNSEADALKALKWTYAADGLQVVISASPDLNQSTDQPHTLALSVVQMEDPSAFSPYTASSAKLSALLLADAPPPGLLALNRIFVSPGETRTVVLPRVEKAKYVGLAAGYYHLDPARSARLYQIGVEVTSSGIVVKNRDASPEPLQIDLRLGADGIQESPGTRSPPVTPTRPAGGLIPAPGAAPAASPAPPQK